MEEYNLIAPAASRRLIEVKIPATVENGEGKAETNEHEFLRVAQTVHNFISAADNIRLNFVAVDQVQPNLLEILWFVLPSHLTVPCNLLRLQKNALFTDFPLSATANSYFIPCEQSA